VVGETEVKLVKDATADYAEEIMHAALFTDLPKYASVIVTTEEVANSIPSLQTLAASAQEMDSAVERQKP
jgi:hypothetical protein